MALAIPAGANYNDWAFGRATSTGTTPLPRPFDQFGGTFGPLAPMRPMPLDVNAPGADRPEPRITQYPVGFNLPQQPGAEGLKLVPFQVLRQLADVYSVVRACIQLRKEEVLGLDWDIVPTDEKSKAMQFNTAEMTEFQSRRKEALAFFQRPDTNYHTYHSWLSAVLEEMLVIDALSIYLHPTRVPGKGLFGSDLASLDILAGEYIRPLLDNRGGRPQPPAPAYQQYLWGVPRSDQMDVILNREMADLPDMQGQKVSDYRADQLLYLPYTRRTWTPYGFSPVERALIPAMTGLYRQRYWMEYYQSGSVPAMFVQGPEGYTPAQNQQLESVLNAQATDPAHHHRIVVVPYGSKPTENHPVGLSDSFDATLNEQTLMAFDVQPMELGLMPGGKTSGLGGKGAAEKSEDIQKRKATKPFIAHLKRSIFDFILQQVCGQVDMEWQWSGIDPQEDEEQKAAMLVTLVHGGIQTVDEARLDLGLQPFGTIQSSEPQYFTAAGLVSLNTDPDEEPPTPPSPDAPAEAPPEDDAPHDEMPLNDAMDDSDPSEPEQHPTAKGASLDEQLHELEQFRQYMRHHGTPARFAPKALGGDAYRALVADIAPYGVGPALARARKRLANDDRKQKRDSHLAAVAAAAGAGLGLLARKLTGGQIQPNQFVTQAAGVLGTGYADAYQAGASEAGADLGPEDAAAAVSTRVVAQHPFLSGFALDIAAGLTRQAIANRLNLYTASLTPAYEQGYGAGMATKLGGGLAITWHTTGGDPCDLCEPRDGRVYTQDSLPGYPGDDGFGDLCEGGPNCKCVLVYAAADEQDEPEALAAGVTPDIHKAVNS